MSKLKGPLLVMFSDARIAFEREIRDHHPKIAMQIILTSREQGVPPGEVDQGIAIGAAAAYFNIIMEGMYSQEQIEDMYQHLFHKLRDSRKHILNGSSGKRVDKVVLDSVTPADMIPSVPPKDRQH
jgi:hypothetical protein